VNLLLSSRLVHEEILETVRKVFISYTRDDSEAARNVVESLGDAEVAGWMDEADVNSGAPLSVAIKKAMREASAVIVLVSSQSAYSEWLQFEVGAALAMDKHIIPVVISGGDSEHGLPEWLKDMKYIDARKLPIGQLKQELARAVSAA
jgi:hypothetical protein